MAQPPNPYETPLPVDPEPSWWDRIRGWFVKRRIASVKPIRFSQGHAVIFSGIAYFIDPKVPDELYAASPSIIDTTERMNLIESEAREHLPALLESSRSLKRKIVGRRLVVRIVESYADGQNSFLSERATDHVVRVQAESQGAPSEPQSPLAM